MNTCTQTALCFQSPSPINRERLGGQNLRLYEWLSSGRRIHCMMDAMKTLKIGYLNSRISDLVNKHGLVINKRYVQVRDISGEITTVREYWMDVNA